MIKALTFGLVLALFSSSARAVGVNYGPPERRYEKMCEVLLRGDLPPYPREAIASLFLRTFYVKWLNDNVTPEGLFKLGLIGVLHRDLLKLRLYVLSTVGDEIFANFFLPGDLRIASLPFSETRLSLWHSADQEPTEMLAQSGFVTGPDPDGVMTYVRASVGLTDYFAEIGLQFPCAQASRFITKPEISIDVVSTAQGHFCQVDVLSFRRVRGER